MHLDCIVGDLEDLGKRCESSLPESSKHTTHRLVLVRPKILSHGGCDTGQMVARRGSCSISLVMSLVKMLMRCIPGVGHAQFLDQTSTLHPRGKVDDLLAIQVDDAEALALLDRERVAMGGGDDVRLRAMTIVTLRRASVHQGDGWIGLRKSHLTAAFQTLTRDSVLVQQSCR